MDDVKVETITDPTEKAGLSDIAISALPEWFDMPEANQFQLDSMADKDAFAAYIDGKGIGLIAIKYHFGTTAEIWWMGVHPLHQKKGAGLALLLKAVAHAKQKGCRYMMVNILSDRSADTHYDRLRGFYTRNGFAPLFEYNEDDPSNPMMWMIRDLSA